MRTAKRKARILLVSMVSLVMAVVLLGVSGCALRSKLGGAGDFPLKVTDNAGREVTLDRRPVRLVSLAPSNTEILFALGAGPKVVGVDSFSDYPEEAKNLTKVGSFSKPDVEAIVALKPDLVLGTNMNIKGIDQFEKVGLKVLILDPRTFEGVYDNLTLLGKVLGTEKQAQKVVDTMRSKLGRVSAALSKVKPEDRVPVYYEVYSDPLMSVGPGTFIHQVITLAGGRNLFADATVDYPVVGSETVVARDPHVILYPDFHGNRSLTIDKVKARPGWDKIQAVAKARVYSVDANIVSRPGPRLADAVETMAKLLYPDLFGK